MEDGIWVRFPVYTQYAPVVELAIHDRLKICCPLRLVGSSPTRSTKCTFSSTEEHPNTNRKVMGSNPLRCTKDDTKRRMVSVERRDARVHTKDK